MTYDISGIAYNFFCSKVSCVTGGLVCYSDNGLVECCTGYECVPIGTLGYCLEVYIHVDLTSR